MRKKDIVLLVILVVVLIVGGYWLWGGKTEKTENVQQKDNQNTAQQVENQTGSTTTVAATSATSTAPAKPSTYTKVVPKSPLSVTQRYLDALGIYKKTGYYFQFLACHASPGTLTLKAGKKFMLDNKDNKTRSIKILGGQSFSIGAYNFAIANAPSKAGTYYITCDGGGSAQIKVQM